MGIYKFKVISSLEKPMPSDSINKFKAIKRLTALKGERISFQIVTTDINDCLTWRGTYGYISIGGELAP